MLNFEIIFNTFPIMSTRIKKTIRFFWITFFIGLISVFLLFSAVEAGWLGELPTFEDLENPKTAVATEIISSDGEVIGKFYIQNRTYTKYEELSPNLVKALIATEDVRFKDHSGIDLRGVIRAIAFLGGRGGASTISQQLALNLFSERAKGKVQRIAQKFKEWNIAIKLEKNYTKQEIVAMYLNTVDFGRNVFGIKSAANYYFGKTPDKLNVQESAVLVGLLKGPSLYNPVPKKNRTKKALIRRNTVLNQMAKYEYLKQNICDSIKKLPIELDLNRENHTQGLATYFREYLKQEMKIWANDESTLKPDGSKYNIYKDGLKIYTTIDSKMQYHAEKAMELHMKDLQKTFFKHWKNHRDEPWNYKEKHPVIEKAKKRSNRYKRLKRAKKTEKEIEKIFKTPTEMRLFTWKGFVDTMLSPLDSIKYANHFLHAGFLSMAVGTGEVKAWVGGINMEFNQYDHVTGIRQVGSTFKPFLYTKAIDNGIEPCTKIPNQKVVIKLENGQEWSPENSDAKYGGYHTLFSGLAGSVNVVAAYLMKQVGPQAVIDLTKRMGVEQEIEPYPSIALGTFDISVYEMVGAYGTFPNKGIWAKPIVVTRIEDRKGNVLPLTQNFQPKTREAFDETTAYTMVKLMQGVTNGGTATRMRRPQYGGIKGEWAGKTGTTQGNSDGWFICYNQELVNGCWVGADSRHVAFRSTALGQGANMALPVVTYYLRRIYDDKRLDYEEKKTFEKPKKPLRVEIDCTKFTKEAIQEKDTTTAADIFN